MGIITNGDSKQQLKKLKQVNILHYFKYVIISGEVGFSKPDNRIFNLACKQTNLNPEEIIYVGDNLETDIKPALNLGMNAVLIDRNNQHKNMGCERINSLRKLNLN